MAQIRKLVLVPGLLCDEALWRHQAAHLRDLVEVVIADITRHDDLGELARDVLRQAGDGPFALAGLSMGGYTAFEILRQAPDRVVRLALLDTTPDADTPEVAETRRQRIERTRAGEFDEVVREMVPMLLHPDRAPALGDAVVAMAHRIGPEAFVRQQTALLHRRDSWEVLPATRCSSLVLCGRQDLLTPVEVHERMEAALPNARLKIIEGSGHLTTIERPARSTSVLRGWLLWRM